MLPTLIASSDALIYIYIDTKSAWDKCDDKVGVIEQEKQQNSYRDLEFNSFKLLSARYEIIPQTTSSHL